MHDRTLPALEVGPPRLTVVPDRPPIDQSVVIDAAHRFEARRIIEGGEAA